ncbi:hypothetical protein SVAN01_04671 [Stagonosporopsis vannaccii]|nr:hypothetical protein SVAN01_04671 [Stagonosporopsis vannaccii]
MTASKLTFTARENEVLALAWQCFTTEPKVDINKLAALTGASHTPLHERASPLPALCLDPLSDYGRRNAMLTLETQYTHSSASTTLGKLKARMKSASASTATATANANAPATRASGRTKRAAGGTQVVRARKKTGKEKVEMEGEGGDEAGAAEKEKEDEDEDV